MSLTWSGLANVSGAVAPPGYQCSTTKSMCGPAMDSTVWSQDAVSSLPTRASGQFAGVVSTAPTLTVGSTVFMASAYATTSLAYPVGLLSAWLSASQLAP